jgi:hypothetical protein
VPEMADRLLSGEEFHLVVSPAMREARRLRSDGESAPKPRTSTSPAITWPVTARETLDAYREAADRRH